MKKIGPFLLKISGSGSFSLNTYGILPEVGKRRKKAQELFKNDFYSIFSADKHERSLENIFDEKLPNHFY
jgi:hypothetical protein